MERKAVRTTLLALLLAAPPATAHAAPAKLPANAPAAESAATRKSTELALSKTRAAVPGSLPEVLPEEPKSRAAHVDPKRGQGARRVNEPEAREKPREAKRVEAHEAPRRAAPESVKPAARVEAPRPAPRPVSPELATLREAELALFPRPLPGVVPGWSWDLPRPVAQQRPELVMGAPAAARLGLPERAEPARDTAWLRSLLLPNLPVRFEQRVLQYLRFYRDNPNGRAIARAWAKKLGRYGPSLRAELAKAGIPSDLVCLSLVESGHSPTIVSPAGAAGLWQFMPDAGRAYGLVIDRWVDERLDPDRATEAAARYLSELYRRFGSWDLAMAAYNMGHGGLGRAIRKYNTNDYWELARYEGGLPWETTLYVPKILATAITLGNRKSFGLDDVAPDPGELTESVLVAPGVSLDSVARLAGVGADLIAGLNPQYLAGRTPPPVPGAPGTSWRVRVPGGKGSQVQAGLARLALKDESYRPHVVKPGETLNSIAQARGTTEAQMRLINQVDPKEALVPGSVLLVPEAETKREEEVGRSVVVVPPRRFDDPDRRRIFYRVASGDLLERLAEGFGVTRAEILLWNTIDDEARLQSDMTLQLFVPRTRDLSRMRYLTEATTRVLVAGSPEFFDYFEGQNGRRRLVIRARKGDSLAEIGKRYGMTIGWMERINRRPRNDDLDTGTPVVVYTDRTRPAPGDVEFEEPRARLAAEPSTATALASPVRTGATRASAD